MLHKVSIGNEDDMDGVQGADQVSGIAEQLREELRQEEDDVSDMRQTESCADPGLRCRRVFVFCVHQLQQEPCASATCPYYSVEVLGDSAEECNAAHRAGR